MIFSAGFGKRLLPVTNKIPKALVTIKRRPILDWIVTFLIQSGVDEIIINTHYLANQVESFIRRENYKIPITCVYEKELLGTGGGLHNTRNKWGLGDIYICNVDILCDFDLETFYQFHLAHKSKITLAVNDIQSSSMLLIDEQGYLCGWEQEGKPSIFCDPIGKITKKGFCGMQFFNTIMFERMKTPPFESIVEQYMEWVDTGIQIKTWSIGGRYWIDIGTPVSLKQAEQSFNGYGNYSPS